MKNQARWRKQIDAAKKLLANTTDKNLEPFYKFINLVDGSARMLVGIVGKRKVWLPAKVVCHAAFEISVARQNRIADPEYARPFITRAEVACAMVKDNSDPMFYAFLEKITGLPKPRCEAMNRMFCARGEHIVITTDQSGLPIGWRWEKPKPEAMTAHDKLRKKGGM